MVWSSTDHRCPCGPSHSLQQIGVEKDLVIQGAKDGVRMRLLPAQAGWFFASKDSKQYDMIEMIDMMYRNTEASH